MGGNINSSLYRITNWWYIGILRSADATSLGGHMENKSLGILLVLVIVLTVIASWLVSVLGSALPAATV